jgi:hypothetical protein
MQRAAYRRSMRSRSRCSHISTASPQTVHRTSRHTKRRRFVAVRRDLSQLLEQISAAARLAHKASKRLLPATPTTPSARAAAAISARAQASRRAAVSDAAAHTRHCGQLCVRRSWQRTTGRTSPHTHSRTHAHTHGHMVTHTHTHPHTQTRSHRHRHTHMHTHTGTHTHARARTNGHGTYEFVRSLSCWRCDSRSTCASGEASRACSSGEYSDYAV